MAITEHRWSDRAKVKLVGHLAFLAPDGWSERRCTIRDIGLEGVFVAGLGNPPPCGIRLDLGLDVPTEKGVLRKRVPTTVVHHARDGVGLVFLAFNQVVFRYTDDLLRRARSEVPEGSRAEEQNEVRPQSVD